MPGRYISPAFAAILLLAGCAVDIRKPLPVCPGKESVAEALAALQSQSQNVVPLRARGQCVLQYYADKKKHRENLTVQVRVNPPFEIYLQGDKAFVPKAVILGSNEREFWLSISPKEISTHWWGLWAEQDNSEGFLINPRTLLEALGLGEIDAEQDWSLSNEGPFDILTKREQGTIVKKIYVYSCEYRVRRIEFFDSNGQVAARAELDKYTEVSEGFSVPALIKVTTYARNNAEDPLGITLNLRSIRPAKMTEALRSHLFGHPQPKGFKYVYRVVNGKWIEQAQ
jgi:hypothetical protein